MRRAFHAARWGQGPVFAALFAAVHRVASAADDSCEYARDGACDAPPICDAGTDATDCGGETPTFGGSGSTDGGLPEPPSFDASEAVDGDPFESLLGAASAGEWLVAGLLVAAAVLIVQRRALAPRSGTAAAGLLVFAVALAGLRWLPDTVLEVLYSFGGAIGIGAQPLLLATGLSLLIFAVVQSRSEQAAASPLESVVRAALHPDMTTTDSEEISAARRLCQTTAQRLEERLGASAGRFHLYAEYDAVSRPWVQVDRLCDDGRGTFVARLRMEFRPEPFAAYPVVVDVDVDDRGRRRRVTSIVELGTAQVDALADCLAGTGGRFVWQGERLREWPWQLWRPRQQLTVLESPFLAGLRANVKMALWVLAIVAVGLIWTAFPISTTVVLVALGIAWRRWYVPPPNYRVVNGSPSRPPRSLLALDSWQAVVRDLGAQRDDVAGRLEARLKAHLTTTDDPVTVRWEDIWYQGAGGKVERQQLSIGMRRALVFVRIYRYGSDLFVGWDAHVNRLAWTERAVRSGHRASDGLKVQLVAVDTHEQPLNEYDVTDANFLLEATHSHLTALVKDVLRERQIDQELDFSIVRESRQGLVRGSAPTARRRIFSRA